MQLASAVRAPSQTMLALHPLPRCVDHAQQLLSADWPSNESLSGRIVHLAPVLSGRQLPSWCREIPTPVPRRQCLCQCQCPLGMWKLMPCNPHHSRYPQQCRCRGQSRYPLGGNRKPLCCRPSRLFCSFLRSCHCPCPCQCPTPATNHLQQGRLCHPASASCPLCTLGWVPPPLLDKPWTCLLKP